MFFTCSTLTVSFPYISFVFIRKSQKKSMINVYWTTVDGFVDKRSSIKFNNNNDRCKSL